MIPIEVVVDEVREEAEAIRSFRLVSCDGRSLPTYTAGAHIDLLLSERLIRSYSLIGPLDDPRCYRIAVNRDPGSRGGSRTLHDTAARGSRLLVTALRNQFPLVETAAHSVLIAGGIGITPLWCMVQRLNTIGASWELHYAARTRRAAAFVSDLHAAALSGAGRLETWFDDERSMPMPLATVVRGSRNDAHLYCCGPGSMLSSFRDACDAEASDRVHLEYFRPSEEVLPSGGFTVELARSGLTVEVPAGCSILDALMMQGIDAPYSCYEGVCGTCETRVLEGIPDHRDQLLSDKVKAENRTMLICCSGSRTRKLVLDL